MIQKGNAFHILDIMDCSLIIMISEFSGVREWKSMAKITQIKEAEWAVVPFLRTHSWICFQDLRFNWAMSWKNTTNKKGEKIKAQMCSIREGFGEPWFIPAHLLFKPAAVPATHPCCRLHFDSRVFEEFPCMHTHTGS